MVANGDALKQVLDEMYEWRRAALWAPIETLSQDQVDYRRQFWEDVARMEEKYRDLDWDMIFAKKVKPRQGGAAS